jgi:hypothetical protein
MRSTLLIVVIVVAVALQSPPLPIPGIHPMQTPDLPINVFVVATIVNVALFLLCLPPAECSLTASLHVAIVRGVGCDSLSSSLLSLQPSCRELHPCPSLVST